MSYDWPPYTRHMIFPSHIPFAHRGNPFQAHSLLLSDSGKLYYPGANTDVMSHFQHFIITEIFSFCTELIFWSVDRKERTVWHEIFAGVYFADWRVLCQQWSSLRELIFAIRTDWIFLVGINFCDFQKVPSTQHWWYFGFCYKVGAIEIHIFKQYYGMRALSMIKPVIHCILFYFLMKDARDNWTNTMF